MPSFALKNDVEVKVEVAPKEEGTASAVYKFQPEGTVFSVAATVSVSTGGIVVPEGKTLSLATNRDGAWVRVADAKVVANAIEAPIVTLGSVALVLSESGPTSKCASTCMAQPGSTCCTACGCATTACKPVCNEGFTWDCELQACYNYKTHERQD